MKTKYTLEKIKSDLCSLSQGEKALLSGGQGPPPRFHFHTRNRFHNRKPIENIGFPPLLSLEEHFLQKKLERERHLQQFALEELAQDDSLPNFNSFNIIIEKTVILN